MPVPLNFLKDPWADTGDRVQFPYNPDTITELMSWLKGFTAKYQRIPEEGGVYIERREFNQILYLLTKQVIDAFNITASDAQLDAERAERIEADEKEKAERIEADNKEKAERIEKDNDLQQQLNAKFMSVEDMGSFTHGVNYYADEPCFLIARFEVADSSGKYGMMNAEIERNATSQAHVVDVGQFVFAVPLGHRMDINGLKINGPQSTILSPTSQLPLGPVDKANITITTFLNGGDTWRSKCGTLLGRDNSSGILGKNYYIIK